MRNGEQRVTLIRHGETEWSLSGQHTGTTDIGLTETGQAVARLLKPMLAEQKFEAVLVSPMRRARQACELAGLGALATIDADLCEWKWIGLPVSCGSHFLLHTASLSELGYYKGIGAVERWNVAVA